MNEIMIDSNSKAIKARDEIIKSCIDFPVFILEASLSLNYSLNVLNSFASIVFFFYSMDDHSNIVITSLRDFLLNHFKAKLTDNHRLMIDLKLEQLSKCSRNFNDISAFQSIFGELVSDMIHYIIKQSPASS